MKKLLFLFLSLAITGTFPSPFGDKTVTIINEAVATEAAETPGMHLAAIASETKMCAF